MTKGNEINPKVSVILTTYNRAERFLKRAVQSVIDQSFTDWELLIIDDCSTDNTTQVCEEFIKQDPCIKYIRLDKHFGSDTRGKNVGLLRSKGKYIAYLDDDCEFYPYHLEKLVEKLERNPELDLVYGDMWVQNADDPADEGQMGISIPAFDGQFLLNRCFIDTSEVVHKRELGFKVGGWDEKLPKFVDWNFWVRIMKSGAQIQRLPMVVTIYYYHKKQKSNLVKSKQWFDDQLQMTMYEPSFLPASCYVYVDSLYHFEPHNDEVLKYRENEINPKVAIFTIAYDRVEYTKRMFKSLNKSTNYPFDWLIIDNGSKDETVSWILANSHWYILNPKNMGISGASNQALDEIFKKDYQIIIKADNDCEFMTFGWLETAIDLWKRNHLLYMSPYPEGLVDNPGGAQRVGYATIGKYFIECCRHLSGLCTIIDAKAYKNFRWKDQFLHGNQDREASMTFDKMGYMPLYFPSHRIMHMDGTSSQHKKYPKYFERRIQEKRTTYATDA